MTHAAPKRSAIGLQAIAAFAAFALTIACSHTASASCGDYLAGHHGNMSNGSDGKVKSYASFPASVPCSSACENGRCQQAPVMPQRELPRVSSLREVARVLEDLRDAAADDPDHRWCYPTSSSRPCSPFLAVASRPPECM